MLGGRIGEARVIDRPRGQRHQHHADQNKDHGADQPKRDFYGDGGRGGATQVVEEILGRHVRACDLLEALES
jgi:hypothetical protein